MKLEMVHICIVILIGGSAIKDNKFVKKKYWRGNIKSLKYQTPTKKPLVNIKSLKYQSSTNKPFEEFPVIDGDQNNDPPIFDIDNDDREPLLTPIFRRNRIQTTSTQSQMKNTVIEREMWSSKRPDFIGNNGGKKDSNELWTTKTNIWGVTERTQVDVKMLTSSSLVNMTNYMTMKGPTLLSTTQQTTSITMSSIASTKENKMSTTITTMMSSVSTPTSPMMNKTSMGTTTIATPKTDVDETGKPGTEEDMTMTSTVETSTASPVTDVDKKEMTTQFLEGNDETSTKSRNGKTLITEKMTTLFQDDTDRFAGTSTTTIKSITTLDVERGRRETTKMIDDGPTKSEEPTLKLTAKSDKDDRMTTISNDADTGPAVEYIPGKFPRTTMKDENAGGVITQVKPDEPDAENVTFTIKRFLVDVTTESEITTKPKTFMSSMDQVSSTPNEDSTTKKETILLNRNDPDDVTKIITVKTLEPTTMLRTQAPTTVILTTQKPLIATVKPTVKVATTKEAKDIGWNREPLLKSGQD